MYMQLLQTFVGERFHIIDLEWIDVVRFLSINIYAPNENNPQFYHDLFTQMEDPDTKVLDIGRRLEFRYGFWTWYVEL